MRYGQPYSLVLMFLALLAGYLRVSRARRIAAAQIIKRELYSSRTFLYATTIGFLAAAIAAAIYASQTAGKPWLWVAVIVLFLSGAQGGVALRAKDEKTLAMVIRLNGFVFWGIAAAIYGMLVRRP